MSKSSYFFVFLSKIFFLLTICFFLNFPVKGQTGLINAMSFEEAEDIAFKSIRRASGIRVKDIEFKPRITNGELSQKMKKEKYLRNCLKSEELREIHKNGTKGSENYGKPFEGIDDLQKRMNKKCFPNKRMRLTDTLDFLGITDEFRLAALRSYIVRNVEFGVQNVWGVDETGTAQFYVLSGKQLEDIKTSTTVIDLAKKIQSTAALPFLSYATAEMIIRNCRLKITGDNSAPEIVERKISVDINGDNIPHFAKCLDSVNQPKTSGEKVRYRYGVQTVKIIDNEGDPKFYYLTDSFKSGLNETIKTDTYKSLIEKMVKFSRIPSSPKFIAAQIVINALLAVEKEKIEKKNLEIAKENAEKILKNSLAPLALTIEYRQPLTNFRVSKLLLRIYEYGCSDAQKQCDPEVSVRNDLNSIGVDAIDLMGKIEKESCENKYFVLDKNNEVLVKTAKISFKKPLEDTMTIEQIIEQVQVIIEG